MTKVQFYFPKHALTRKLKESGGKTIASAIRDAEAGLASIAGRCEEAVDEALEKALSYWRASPAQMSVARLRALYYHVNSLIGLCSVAGLPEMDQAAYSLCDLLDGMAVSKHWDLEPIEVHFRALVLLRHPARLGCDDVVDDVLLGLRRVRERYSPNRQGGPEPTRVQ